MEPSERARAELARLITERREDYAGLSRLLGRNAAYVQQYIKRGVPRRLSENDRKILARYFDVSEALFGGPGDPLEHDAAKLVAIPRLDVEAAAGSGSLADRERTVAHLGFDTRWLKQICNASPAELSIIRVQGDSMAPTLSNGDDILVDRSENGQRLRDGIYVLRRDDSLIVKRLAVHPGSRKLTISSDNPAYPSWPDCDPASVAVLGRVVWTGRRVS